MTESASRGTPAEKAARARRAIDESLDRLGEALAAGDSERLVAMLKASARFHSYSFTNVMLILSQRPEATRVAGFQTWKSLGRSVKKGERGIAIFAPMRLKPRSGEHKRDVPDDDDGKRVLRFRVVHVFDIAQTEGEPLPELAAVAGDASDRLTRLESAVRDSGVTIETSDDLGGADGVSRGGAIVLRSGLGDGERFSVLVHEYAHELLHHGGEQERPPKLVRETEAEAVAFVVCEWAGLDAAAATADYIRLYRGDQETLAASLERIQKASARIIAMLEGEDAEKVNGPNGSMPREQFARTRDRGR